MVPLNTTDSRGPTSTRSGKVGKGLAIMIAALGLFVAVRIYFAYSATSKSAPELELQLLKGLEAEYLITPEHARDLPAPLGAEFAVTDTGNIILRAGADLLEAEAANLELRADRLATEGKAPDSFALDNGAVLTIAGRFFGQLEGGVPTKSLPMPSEGMRLASSRVRGLVYVFGGPEPINHRAYVFKESGAFGILAELPAPIVAVTDSLGSFYLATDREILRMRDHKIELAIRLPADEGPIVSMAASDDDETLYYSTDTEVYALHGVVSLGIVKNAGGALCWRGDALYLWSVRRQLLVKLTQLTSALYPAAP